MRNGPDGGTTWVPTNDTACDNSGGPATKKTKVKHEADAETQEHNISDQQEKTYAEMAEEVKEAKQNLAYAMDMLAMYDIETLLVDAESLARRGLIETDLQLPATLVTPERLPSLFSHHAPVFIF